MGCGDVCLLNLHAHLCAEAERRAGLVNLTVSMISLPDGVTCDTGGCQ